jgi:hypothetical protein
MESRAATTIKSRIAVLAWVTSSFATRQRCALPVGRPLSQPAASDRRAQLRRCPRGAGRWHRQLQSNFTMFNTLRNGPCRECTARNADLLYFTVSFLGRTQLLENFDLLRGCRPRECVHSLVVRRAEVRRPEVIPAYVRISPTPRGSGQDCTGRGEAERLYRHARGRFSLDQMEWPSNVGCPRGRLDPRSVCR